MRNAPVLEAVTFDGMTHFAVLKEMPRRDEGQRWTTACHMVLKSEHGARVNQGEIDCLECLGSADYAKWWTLLR